MEFKVSGIVKTTGAVINIDVEEDISRFEKLIDDFQFKGTFSFKGQLRNSDSILKLEGNLIAYYTVECYRCLKEIEGKLDIAVQEDFVRAGSNTENDSEAYEYDHNIVHLDKALADNIILNLPMKRICSKSCKGLCQECGANLNEGICACSGEEFINPKMQVLKNLFKDE